ncbi:uncharacterized protein LOC131205743 [Anopheles bellator]|uniref:uncharacterized protein LOC131205743 n=1 Tax=Anopheles bellator TaxID=139047 RepID=UPI002649285A|nr:uncharacterized protein LOC131205743 [Anopheles bellator]
MSERNEDIKEEDLGEYDRYVLEQLVVNDWGLSVTTLNRMIYCGVNEVCLHVIEDAEISELFSDPRLLGQKIMFKHRLKQWRLGELFNGNTNHHLTHHGSQTGTGSGTPAPSSAAQSLLHHHQQLLAAAGAALNGAAKRQFPFFPDPGQHHLSADDDVIGARAELCATGGTTPNGDGVQQKLKRRHQMNSPSTGIGSSSSSFVAGPPQAKRKFEDPSIAKGGIPGRSGALGDVPVKIDRDGLLKILQSNQSGRSVLTAFQPHEHLDRRAQTIITHCIVDQFLQYNILFKHRLMSHYAEVITELFPAETKEVYYAPRNTVKRNTSGKLFDRYTNQRLRHKDRLPRVKPFIVDEWSENKTFEHLAAINEAAQLNGSLLAAVAGSGSIDVSANGGFGDDYSNGTIIPGGNGSDDGGNVSTDFLQPLATMFVEGEQPLTSNGNAVVSAVDYSTREEEIDD